MIYNLFANIKNNYILLLILLLATVLRLYNIDFQSIWIDEIHTMIESDPKISYGEFYDIMFFREQMPHLYFLITRFFTSFIDHSVVVVRAISAFFGVLCVYSIYLLGKELDTKKTGYIAALFLAVNYFHIFYSQEARPYILLCLFTILTFLFLLRLIKKNSIKSAIYYGLSVALMINTHFFGLFVLVSQILILIIYLFKIEKEFIKKYIFNAFVSGLIILLLFIPSMPILFKISKMGSFWIPPPSNGFFKQTFNEFFGKSEFIIYTAILLVIAFFVKIFLEKENKTNRKYLDSFIFLMVWLFIVFMIPYIRSYTNVPMLISRYFMSALPAVILIISIGLANIKTRIIVVLIACIFVFSSFVDLFPVRKYYSTPNKTQFREITANVNYRNTENNPIISHWGWHIKYFFDDTTTINQFTLNQYVDKLRFNEIEPKSFWYLDAHFRPYEVSLENQSYLDNNFYMVEQLNYYDTWANHYVYKDNKQLIYIYLNDFSPNGYFNGSHILMASNSVIESKPIYLEKGTYRLALKTKSLPNPPIDNENAHLDIYISEQRVGGFFTSAEKEEITCFDFVLNEEKNTVIEIVFDNDFFDDFVDRNVFIYEVSIEKKYN